MDVLFSQCCEYTCEVFLCKTNYYLFHYAITIHAHFRLLVHVIICMCVYHAYMHVCISCIYAYANMCVMSVLLGNKTCMYIHICVYIHISIYICIYMFTSQLRIDNWTWYTDTGCIHIRTQTHPCF